MRGDRARVDPSRWTMWLLLAIAGAAFFVRVVGLDHRPMHGDEANQAMKTGRLLETGRYVFDPADHHGPTLYYLGVIPALLQGTRDTADLSEVFLRLIPAVFSASLILLLIPLRRALGDTEMVFAGILLAVSPPFVFYGRYYVQESILLFFALAALAGGYKYLKTRSYIWASLTGLALGLMHATKETAIITWVAAAAGVVAVAVVPGPDRPARLGALRNIARNRATWLGAGLGIAVSLTLHAGFFTNPRGAVDAFVSYSHYLERSAGGIHDKPWHYYFGLMTYVQRAPGPWWSLAFVLLMAVSGATVILIALRAASNRRWTPLFLLVATVTMVVIYSLIPYKTPWLLLNPLVGITLIAGIGMGFFFAAARSSRARIAVLAAFVLGTGHLAWQTWLSEREYAADVRNPWVYAHTSSAFMRLPERIAALSAIDTDGKEMLIQVIQPDRDYWPLPWYLRAYGRVGYWDAAPDELSGSVILAPPDVAEEIAPALEDRYISEMHSLRPAELRVLFIQRPLWDTFMDSRR